MRRFENWPELLARFLAERNNMPFEWGRNDCTLFAADCVWSLTGIDPVPDLRGTYTTALGAQRAIADVFGSPSLEVATMNMAARWGVEEIPPLMAQRGDVVLHPNDGRPCLAISVGRQCAAPSEAGLAQLTMRPARRAWRTPY